MRVLLDACVLFPTVMREILIGAADAGLYEPLWSERILEEWARACIRLGDGAELIARGEIALLRIQYPYASYDASAAEIESIHLPDPDDRHVLASAINAEAGILLTENPKDFPTRVLSLHGIVRRDPDSFLVELAQDSSAIAEIVETVCQRAQDAPGSDIPKQAVLKRAKLTRLAKFLNS